MKKLIAIFAVMLIFVCCLTACNTNNSTEKSDKISIVTTVFPEYDWVKEIAGDRCDNVDLTMLLDSSVDLHSFQPTAEDILKIASCDLFIYVGGESDEWVKDALKKSTNKDMKVINLLDVLGDKVKEEKLIEGMETEEEEEIEEGPEYDEHVWLSLKNAQVFVDAISEALMEIDESGADTYRANASAYNEKLDSLNSDYEAAVESGTFDTLLFGDRFPFRYMADDYGLNYYAAFTGCSAESEASFETIYFLADKVDELGLHSIITLENSDGKIANTIVENTRDKNQKVLILDSMQSVTSEDVENGVSYISIMKKNLDVLENALK